MQRKVGSFIHVTGMSAELSNYLVSWVVTYLGDLQPTYIGVIIYLLSSMDILVSTKTNPSAAAEGYCCWWKKAHIK